MWFKSLIVAVALVMVCSVGCRKKQPAYGPFVPPPPSAHSHNQNDDLPIIYPPDMADGSSGTAMGGRASSIFEPLPEVQPIGEPVFEPDPASTPAPAVMTFDQTPAPAPAPTHTPAPTGGSTYTVSRGDTLWSVATRHYGNGQRWRDIAAANGINNERQLRVGQRLVIP